MKFKAGNRTVAPSTVHSKVDKPDPNGNRQQRRAAERIARTLDRRKTASRTQPHGDQND